ncbi:MAG: ketoacyl-ACP synthase III [Myxococcales bacterium]|nr:ketoacyl-ACP synthase III [Myxococcales bacterium]
MGALFLHGAGHFHPENVIDNRFLADLAIDTTEEWIRERVGIERRHTVLPLDYLRQTHNADVRAAQEAALYTNAETGKRAATMALTRAGITAQDIGMVVAGGCCPDRAIPSEACGIAAALGIEAPSFDINSACSSFGAQLHVLSSMQDLPEYVLVVNPENTTRVVDYRDRSTAVLWGDGTSAAVLSSRLPSRLRVTDTSLASSPAGCDAVTIPRLGHFAQNGSAVQRFAIKTTVACMERLLPAARERSAATGGRLLFIGHQANRLMLESSATRAGIAADRHWHNVTDFGNTGAAGAPTVLSQHWDDLLAGDTVLIVMVGSGLTWTGMRVEVAA